MYLRHTTYVWIRLTSNNVVYKLHCICNNTDPNNRDISTDTHDSLSENRWAILNGVSRDFSQHIQTNVSGCPVQDPLQVISYRLTYRCYTDWPTAAISIDLPLPYRLTYRCHIDSPTAAISIDLPLPYRLTYRCHIDWPTAAISIHLPLLYRLTYRCYIDWPTAAISIDLPPTPFPPLHLPPAPLRLHNPQTVTKESKF
jgi:hypothetical protein